MQRDLDHLLALGLECSIFVFDRHVVRLVLNRRRPGLPGEKLITYRIKGPSHEHGNLQSSAGDETSGKPPSPAMSRRRGGAFVVVRARESRAHGEGRQ